MPERFQLPVQMRAAAVAPESLNEDDRTFELVWTTGAQVRRTDFFDGDYIEELEVSDKAIRLGRLNGGAPLLDAHGMWSLAHVIGVVESAWIKGGEGRAKVRIATGDEAVDQVWNKVRTGIIRNVSVGYQVHEYRETRKGDQRTMLAVDWEPLEISLVPVGADSGAGVRANSETSPCTITRADGGADTGDVGMTDNPNEKPAAGKGATAGNQPGNGGQQPAATEAERAQPTPADAETPAGADANNGGGQPAAQPDPAPTPDNGQRAAPAGNDVSREILDMCALAGVPSRTAADMIGRGLSKEDARKELLAMRDARAGGGDEIASHHQPGADTRSTLDVNAVYRNFNAGGAGRKEG